MRGPGVAGGCETLRGSSAFTHLGAAWLVSPSLAFGPALPLRCSCRVCFTTQKSVWIAALRQSFPNVGQGIPAEPLAETHPESDCA